VGRFVEALERARDSGRAPIICDIKLRSPAEGGLIGGRDPAAVARAMAEGGAACLSVVTEPEHFGGSLELLRAVVAASDLPVLRKDFVRTAGDVRATRDAGASCLLLIVAMLDQDTLAALHREAHACGLETLVEAHNSEEVRRALELDIDLLGINNRDIQRLEVDGGTPAITLRLLAEAPPGVRVISESAISSPGDVRAAIEAGALGALVGTAVLRADDTAAFVKNLSLALRRTGSG
jgi:indole-3-glycerol phosphate synthase